MLCFVVSAYRQMWYVFVKGYLYRYLYLLALRFTFNMYDGIHTTMMHFWLSQCISQEELRLQYAVDWISPCQLIIISYQIITKQSNNKCSMQFEWVKGFNAHDIFYDNYGVFHAKSGRHCPSPSQTCVFLLTKKCNS